MYLTSVNLELVLTHNMFRLYVSYDQVMLDTVGPELQVVNKLETPISLVMDGSVVLTPFKGQEASSELLPINFDSLAKVGTWESSSCCF